MSLFSSLPIGIDITPTSLRAASVVRKGDTAVLQVKAEQPLPAGTIVRGRIAVPQAALEALKKLLSSMPGKKQDAIVTLSPDAAFCSWVLAQGTEETEHEIVKLLPEQRSDVHLLTHVFGKRDGKDIIGFAALPKDIEEQYAALFAKAGLRIAALTTATGALAAAMQAKEMFLLVTSCDTHTVLSILRDGWVVDEDVVAPTAATIEKRAEALLKEYAESGMRVLSFSAIGTAIPTVAGMSPMKIFPWIAPQDGPFAAAAAAAFAGSAITMNFRTEASKKSGLIPIIAAGAGIAILLGALVWMLMR